MRESFRSDVSNLLFQTSAFHVIILKVVMTTRRVQKTGSVSVKKNHDAETVSMSAKISVFAVLWVILL